MIYGFVTGQDLKLNQPVIAADSRSYLEATFEFTKDWDDTQKWAVFSKGEEQYSILLDENDNITRASQLNLTEGSWCVCLLGKDLDGVTRITTIPQKLEVRPTCVGDPFPIKPPSVGEQILEIANQAKKVAESVRADADSGAFDGGYYTVSASYADGILTLSYTPSKPEMAKIPDSKANIDVTVDPEEITKAVEQYFVENPIQFPVTSVNGKTGKVELTAEDVKAVATSAVVNEKGQDQNKVMSQKAVTDEFDSPSHNTMIVTAMQEGIGFKADKKASEIKRHADGGGVVILRFNAPDGSGEQSYPYETYDKGLAVFRRSVILKEAQKVQRIVITIDERSNVVKKDETLNVATKADIQALEDDKANYIYHVIATDKVSQADAREVLSDIGTYDGKLIEFLTNGEHPSKCVATGRIMTRTTGDAYLVSYNLDGTITTWDKDSFEKHQMEAKNLINEPIVDLDNLTVDVAGNPPVLYMVRAAKNKPENTSADGSMMVIPHAINKQLFIYTDMDSGKMWTKVVTGTDGQHSFGKWEALGSSVTVDSALSESSTNPVQNKVINKAITELNESLGDKLTAPVPTEKDEGKFLRISGGAAVWQTVPNAKGVAF